MSISDNRIIARAAAADSEAFASLYRQYSPLVFRYGLSVTGSVEAAEDITQDVFASLLRNLARFDPARSEFRSYLYGMVRNLARDRRRRERRFSPIDEGVTRLERCCSDPRRALDAAVLAGRVREEIERLPARYREALELCALHEMSSIEAAARVGVSHVTIRARVAGARLLLRKRLNKILRAPCAADANHTHVSSTPVHLPRRPHAAAPSACCGSRSGRAGG